jgi:pyruvate/2-oxoglutarate dehydrogenase complex dihydrolipoamide acyltransferase (E2) component
MSEVRQPKNRLTEEEQQILLKIYQALQENPKYLEELPESRRVEFIRILQKATGQEPKSELTNEQAKQVEAVETVLTDTTKAALAGLGAGLLVGAVTGGAVVPGIGTIIGAGIGAAIGFVRNRNRNRQEEGTEEISEQTGSQPEAIQEMPEATTAAKRKAKELGVDLSQIEDSGIEDRILVGDVVKAAK